MAQTYTPSVVTSGAAGQIDYPMDKNVGLPGLLADNSDFRALSGSNESGATIRYGVPLRRNGSGLARNSFVMPTTAGAILGLLMRSNTHEKQGFPAINALPDYSEGVPDLKEGNILTKGAIYIECMENVVVDAANLRFHKSGANAGKWGVASSVGNTLSFAAGGWTIRRAGSASVLAILEINTPAGLTVTAD